MKAKFLLNTLCISLLLCSFIQAQGTKSQNTLNPNKVFSIPFGPSMFLSMSFSIEVGEPSRSLLAAIDMRSSGLFINNFTDRSWPGVAFRCDLSQTCKPQGSLQDLQDYTWIIDEDEGKRQLSLAGPLVKEKVNLGSVTLPNADVLIVNPLTEASPIEIWDEDLRLFCLPIRPSNSIRILISCHREMVNYPGTYVIAYKREASLGLSFRRSNPQVPTFFEYLKTEGFVDNSIFSIYLDPTYDGEFMFGGYDAKRAESEFQYTQWQEDQDPTLPGFSLKAKAVGYGDRVYSEKYTVVIDIESPYITIPEWIIDEINQEESSRGFTEEGTCKSIPFLQDIVIEFEGVTIRIPPAAYLQYKDKFTYGYKACEKSLAKVDRSEPRIILGTPFLTLSL